MPIKFTTRNYGGTVVGAKAPAFIAYNNNMTTAKLFGSAEGTPPGIVGPRPPLFPFTSPDVFYAGACSVNNPGSGPAIVSATVPAGGTASTQTIRLPALLLTVNKELGGAASGAEVIATDTQCETGGHGVRRKFTTNSSGQLSEPGLPWSTYDVCASVGITVLTKTTYYHETKQAVEVHSDNGTSVGLTVGATDETGKCP